ncbi:hypothetical protein GGU10DRAFT_388925 [Lentinula aff. detonsa]|uniref:Endoplasmic reticulum Ca-transporting P-type ATPase n=1 Tax=Lentinula aff. detonsa TaxID=2804958 RepID=A0AA38L4L9_9AGAR|nr:hypothetical protein GGU10DRAFT_388925 [Lentinula aff. detonsa]
MVSITVDSPEVSRASLHKSLPWYTYLYTVPFLCLYPVLAYAYYVKYDEWLVSEEWTFLACVTLGSGHALSFLVTRWSTGAKAWIETTKASSIEQADCIHIVPEVHRGKGEIVPLIKKDAKDVSSYTFNYQRDAYSVASNSSGTVTFIKLPYPSSGNPPLQSFFKPQDLKFGLSSGTAEQLKELYGLNEFNIPIPSFTELFSEHATAPFFVFQACERLDRESFSTLTQTQIFCVALWCLDEYWYYSLFTLFMLVVFECTVVWQRVRTLTEFRTMSVTPYPIFAYRDAKWQQISSESLLPGDVVSVNRRQHSHNKPSDAKAKDRKEKEVKETKEAHSQEETTVPADILLLHGQVIVNEAMLSGESTPLVKEGVDLLVDELESGVGLDADGAHKGRVVFSGTKVLQANGSSAVADGVPEPLLKTPDGGCLGVVLRTGFGTAQGQLVRTMIFSTERVSANNLESFLFIGFLLIFAIAASAYVWVKGIERDLKKSKLLLDCVLIITSVVPPELPMELSLAVNASLVALSKFAIFCTEPFRIPFAGRVDVCCFDKTGTITAENLVLEGVTGVSEKDPMSLVNVREVARETTLCLAAAHALVRLDDGTIVGDPMEKTTLENMDWGVGKNDLVSSLQANNKMSLTIRRRFQFSSALKRMCTLSTFQGPSVMGGSGANTNRTLVAVKGAPETIKGMLGVVPSRYDDIYKGYTRQGSRVLALAVKEMEFMNGEKINKLSRESIESELTFAGFLVFHCPLKPDAIATLKMLADSSHRCIMITGDNPLTAVHVAKTVEIVDREVLILDLKEDARDERDLTFRTVDEHKVIPVDPSAPLDTSLFDQYDICITGAAMKQLQPHTPTWTSLVQHTWVYARVSPSQKETILTTLKSLGYITLMAGDGTNDVGALKQAHIGVALLDGTVEDLQKIAERGRVERVRQVYESQLKISARFNQPPPPVPKAIAHLFPDAVKAQQDAVVSQVEARKKNPMEKFDLAGITDKLAEMEGEEEVPKIKLGDASCAAPFTSKLSHVSAVTHIIRQGRCTLVATIQMYKILALNCLITAYSLSVQYLDGIKFGDYQVTITGMLMSVCFLCISRAKPVEKLSRERPLGNIFNLYVLLSVLMQFALHIATLVYITDLAHIYEPPPPTIDLEAKFEPSLLNTAIYLLGLSQQVSTFAINFQGRPFREGIRENSALFYGLLSASAVAFCGATDFMPEMNRWLQIVEMEGMFKVKLTMSMVLDLVGCYVVEVGCKYVFAELEPKGMITRGRERRERRRREEEEKREKGEEESKKDV